MKIFYLIFVSLVSLTTGHWYKDCANSHSSLTTSTLHGEHRCHNAGELVFHDEFEFFDFDVWDHEITMSGGGNWEFQVYWNNRTNSYVKDGKLYLHPGLTADRFGDDFVRNGHLDLWGGAPADTCTANAFWGCDRTGGGTHIINPISSARIRTVGHFGFTYGRVEVRAKLPTGDWLWPAIWMLPVKEEYGLWPTSGEIDLMEGRGNANLMQNGVHIGAEQVGSTLHYGVDYTMNGYQYATTHANSAPGQGFNVDFHKYQMEWTPDYISFSVDDIEMAHMVVPAGGMWEMGQFSSRFPGVHNPWEGYARNAPFDREFHFVLNVAAGGINGFFPDDAWNGDRGKPWSNTSPAAAFDFWNAKDQWYPTWQPGTDEAAMQVDYIKVWAL